jgi:hypothetical protein
MRLTEHKLVVAMARQDLKKYCMHPHVLTLDNIGDPFSGYISILTTIMTFRT